MCKINSQQGICYMAEKLEQGLFINLGGGVGGELGGNFRREGMYVHLWLIEVGVCRKQQDSIKQLSFKKKKERKKERKVLRMGESDFQNYHVIRFKCPISAPPQKKSQYIKKQKSTVHSKGNNKQRETVPEKDVMAQIY